MFPFKETRFKRSVICYGNICNHVKWESYVSVFSANVCFLWFIWNGFYEFFGPSWPPPKVQQGMPNPQEFIFWSQKIPDSKPKNKSRRTSKPGKDHICPRSLTASLPLKAMMGLEDDLASFWVLVIVQGLCYTSGGYPTYARGGSSTQDCFWRGYVSFRSRRVVFKFRISEIPGTYFHHVKFQGSKSPTNNPSKFEWDLTNGPPGSC